MEDNITPGEARQQVDLIQTQLRNEYGRLHSNVRTLGINAKQEETSIRRIMAATFIILGTIIAFLLWINQHIFLSIVCLIVGTIIGYSVRFTPESKKQLDLDISTLNEALELHALPREHRASASAKQKP